MECYFRKLFIIIFKKPLLVAILRLMEISLLPANISTSTALDSILLREDQCHEGRFNCKGTKKDGGKKEYDGII